MATTLGKFRWASGLRGLAAIAFGILALTWPAITVIVLLALFGTYAILDGLFALVASFQKRTRVFREGWLVPLVGILSIAIGVLAFARPGITAIVLLLVIAARAIFTGVLEIAAAIHYHKRIRGEWLLALGGGLSVAFGLLVFAYPLEGALAALWLIGVYAILVGTAQVFFALAAKTLVEEIERPTSPPLPA